MPCSVRLRRSTSTMTKGRSAKSSSAAPASTAASCVSTSILRVAGEDPVRRRYSSSVKRSTCKESLDGLNPFSSEFDASDVLERCSAAVPASSDTAASITCTSIEFAYAIERAISAITGVGSNAWTSEFSNIAAQRCE